MARLFGPGGTVAAATTPTAPAAPQDTNSLNLTRMLARLQTILITPDRLTDSHLRRSRYERAKVGKNIMYAKSLLLRLEQDAQNIKVQSKKQETQSDLVKKREVLGRLAERLRELDELDDHDKDDESSEGEDLLGEDTPSETTDEPTSHGSHQDSTPEPSSPMIASTISSAVSIPIPTPEASTASLTELARPAATTTSSTIRSRAPRSPLFPTPSATTTATATTTTATTEALLSHNRAEQEMLTASMLAMAKKLKDSSISFATSLEDEKGILDGAAQGLDRNESGLQAAQKRMGYLTKMSEGRGFLGRLYIYVMIGGLWVVALLVVFTLPKFRRTAALY